MRKLLFVALIATSLPFLSYSQNRVFSSQKINRTSQGGSFQVACSQSYAIACYKGYMRAFVTKKLALGEYETLALGGSVKVVFGSVGEETSVELVVNNAAFTNLAVNLKNFIESEILKDEFRRQKKVFEGITNRMTAVEAENVFLKRKIERLKADIANCETRIIVNHGALVKYDELSDEQKGLLNDLQSQIDDLLKDLPTK